MTEQIKRALDDTWKSVRPRAYQSKGGFGKRDWLWATVFFVFWLAFYIAHDVVKMPIPTPSQEAMAFAASLLGLYVGRRFRR